MLPVSHSRAMCTSQWGRKINSWATTRWTRDPREGERTEIGM